MIKSHSDIVLLIDAMARLHGRLRSVFAPARQSSGLSEMEQTVLSAVSEAKAAPTVAQIGRSLGHPRQVVQRAANALAEAGLIVFEDNPDHKRASLLKPTAAGSALQADANGRAEEIAAGLLTQIDARQVREANALLDSIRIALEQHDRESAK